MIKSYGIKDDKLLELLNAIVLPKPKTNKEKEMFSECLYEVSDNGSLLDDLIYKRTPFLKLTKDDFEVIEGKPVAPSSITEPEVTPMEVNNRKLYFYELTPKLDWVNDGNDFKKLGFNFKGKFVDGEDISNEIQYPLYGEMEGNIVLGDCDFHILGFINNGEYDYKNGQFIEKNCFYIEVRNIRDTVIDFELELFKIDSIPTVESYKDMKYSLGIDENGRLCKYRNVIEG